MRSHNIEKVSPRPSGEGLTRTSKLSAEHGLAPKVNHGNAGLDASSTCADQRGGVPVEDTASSRLSCINFETSVTNRAILCWEA